MEPRPTRRRGFPGGLRAQLLLGLVFVVGLVFLLGAGLVYMPGAEDLAPGAARTLRVTYVALAVLVVLLFGYAFFTYLVVRPIRAIGVASERAAHGDLASAIKHLPRNEFGRVSRQFNMMLGKLAENRQKLEERLRELDQINRELHQAQQTLIRAERLAGVGQLAAGVAHEVGNPLAAISGYLELLDDDDIDPATHRDILHRSQGEVDRILRILRELLDYSREDKGAEMAAVDLATAIDEAVRLIKAQPRGQTVTIKQEVDADLVAVRAVSSEVVQVVLNLLVNAVDALNGVGESCDVDGESACITISAAVSDASSAGASVAGNISLSVRDNGPGIAPEVQKRIFDPFYTTKDPGAGTGLGLAVCHRLMRRFGGDIRVRSEPGDGACFELIFERWESAN